MKSFFAWRRRSTSRSFERWWREFFQEHDRDVYFASGVLRDHVQSMSDAARAHFVVSLAKVLCQREGLYGTAIEALEMYANSEARRELVGCLDSPARVDDPSSGHAETILRILMRSAPDEYRDRVMHYLFERPVSLHYGMVVWTLWPSDPGAFGRAFVREIRHLTPERLRGTLVFQGFYMNPEPFAAVRAAFEVDGDAEFWQRTREAILATHLPGETEAQRAAVERVLG